MRSKQVRILMAKLGEGYAEEMISLTLAFRDAGYEVIYTDIQRPEAIVTSAIQECVDHIGITTLPGTNIQDLARIVDLLKQGGASRIRVTAGGYLENDRIPEIKKTGIVEFFPIGTSISELIQWSRNNIKPTETFTMEASVYRILEVVGTSKNSWEEAARTAVENAARSFEDLRVAEVVKLDMTVDNNKVTLFRARVSLSFKYRDVQ